MKLSVRIYVDLRQRIEDTMLHELHFWLIGSDASATVAIVESDFYQNPRIVSFEKNGLNMLDADLCNRFLVKIFRMAVAEMRAGDGNAIDWIVSDLTRWINTQFVAAEAATLVRVLDDFERPKFTGQDRAEIRID